MAEVQDGHANSTGGGRGFVRRRAGVAAVVVAALLAAAGTASWAVGTWPFTGGERYCWGAWEEGDEAVPFLDDKDSDRTWSGTAPTAKRPHGTCRVVAQEDVTLDGDTYHRREIVEVTYGRLPQDAAEREKWLFQYLSDAAPLPDGLPGAVVPGWGMLVLPESCDVDGLPTVVTLKNDGSSVSDEGEHYNIRPDTGGWWQTGQLLTKIANEGMRRTGCAPDTPLAFESPVTQLPRESEYYFDEVCGVHGFNPAGRSLLDFEYTATPVSGTLQACTVWPGSRSPFFMATVRGERMAALFKDMAVDGKPWRGKPGRGRVGAEQALARTECNGEPVVHFVSGSTAITDTKLDDLSWTLTAFVDSTWQRLDCDATIPGPR